MKVYTKVVIDMRTMETLEEESYEYEGEITHCGGGGGGTEYPGHMIDHHQSMLGTLLVGGSGVMDAIRDAYSPYNVADVHDPASAIATMRSDSMEYRSHMFDIYTSGIFDTIVNYTKDNLASDTTKIDDLVDAHADKLNEDIENKVLPAFEAGMRDINAVQSSAFAIGRANIYQTRDNAISAFDADVRIRAHFDLQNTGTQLVHNAYALELQAAGMKLEHRKALTHMLVDSARIGIVANSEASQQYISVGASDQLFNIEKWMYGANMLASIGSASVVSGHRPGKMQSAIGGGLSGAAAGGMIGASMATTSTSVVGGVATTTTTGSAAGPWGAAIGAVVGIAAGLLSR